MAYYALTLSVSGPSGIDPFADDCCVCRYSIARDAGSICADPVPPVAKASVATPMVAVVASATTLLVLPMVGTPRGEGDSILAGVVLAA
jgi:hypothetical protein